MSSEDFSTHPVRKSLSGFTRNDKSAWRNSRRVTITANATLVAAPLLLNVAKNGYGMAGKAGGSRLLPPAFPKLYMGDCHFERSSGAFFQNGVELIFSPAPAKSSDDMLLNRYLPTDEINIKQKLRPHDLDQRRYRFHGNAVPIGIPYSADPVGADRLF